MGNRTQLQRNGDKSELQKSTARSVAKLLNKNREAILRTLPAGFNYDRLCRVVVNAVSATPKLAECTPASIFLESVKAFSIGLEPNGVLREGYLVPYKDKATFLPSYIGLTHLAMRSGNVSMVYARLVHEDDKFEIKLGTSQSIEHVPNLDTPSKLHGVYAVVQYKDGHVDFEYMSIKEVEEVRARSRASGAGPWVTDFNEMAKKTVVKRLLKRVPMSVEVAQAVQIDNHFERPDIAEKQPDDDVIDVDAFVIDEEAKTNAAGARAVAKDAQAKLKSRIVQKAVPGGATGAVDELVGILEGAHVPVNVAIDYLVSRNHLAPGQSLGDLDLIVRGDIKADPVRFSKNVSAWLDSQENQG